MKNLDTFSKRILVITFSISIVLLSASAFLLSVQHVTAEPKQKETLVMPTTIGLGISGKSGIYMVWSGSEWQEKRINLN
jgi:hypothetical protein